MKDRLPIYAPPVRDPLSIYASANRTRLIAVAGLLIAAIAVVDWATKPYISLGFLYLFPIMILGGFLSRTQLVGVALVCAVLQEAFSNLPENEAVIRLLFSSAGFVGTGLFISEMIRNRRITMAHVEELEGQIKLREDAEEQLRSLVESSPAAIVTIDAAGRVLLANEAAQHLLASEGTPLQGQEINSYLPSFANSPQKPTAASISDHSAVHREKERRGSLSGWCLVFHLQHDIWAPLGSHHCGSF